MSPNAKEFYNQLVSFHLQDETICKRLENSYKAYIQKRMNLYKTTGILLEGEQNQLEQYFTRLSDSEISEVIKTFKMRMFPALESQVMVNGNTIAFNPIMSSTAIKGFKNSPILIK